jgi:1,4-alpha-glucan branching enzyme
MRKDDNSYLSFKDLQELLVPYVRKLGYTHVEFMPINEYPYDGSWGYQVTGYFSIISRLGSLQQFSDLIDAFHKNGLQVIVDWVPAHFPKDDFGLYEFDGQPLYECALWDRMEHRRWGTRRFEYGRGEVDSFLLSSACYLFDQFAVDGLRVDAVASMLYLDYDRQYNDWTPNAYGGRENIEAINFLKKLNKTLKEKFKWAITIAEESTCFGGVTKSIDEFGLGFDFKWNMGWMNDVLSYCRIDPIFRQYHHSQLTFSMMYSFDEKYILPLSHDEVVHIKGSILNKMFGSLDDKLSGEKLLLAFMYAHPGKKLNFMGYEFGQLNEWNYAKGLDFQLTEDIKHLKLMQFVKQLNDVYSQNPPLYQIENSWDGFEWLVANDKNNNVLAFNRYDKSGNCIMVICNFSGIELKKYTLGQHEGKYKVILNTDDTRFGGSSKSIIKSFKTVKQSSHGKDDSLTIDIPKLACMYLIKQK